MQLIRETLRSSEVAPSLTFRNLSITPLLGSNPDPPFYMTLDDALVHKIARIGEVGRAGHVPELEFVNDGDVAVLLLDGEELVGAKQNRVANLTILVPPRTRLTIPVSCVEAGRWRYDAEMDFLAAKHVMYSKARAAKLGMVSASLASIGRQMSDQAGVWDEIRRKSSRLGTSSPTSAMRDIYERHDKTLEEYVAAIPWVDGQVGGVFSIDGKVVGLELLDHPHTMRALVPKLVRSYALDAIETADGPHAIPDEDRVEALLQQVGSANATTTPAVGLGEDVRLTGERLTGAALVQAGRVIHLSAFRLESEARDETEGSQIQRGSRRLSKWLRSRGRGTGSGGGPTGAA